MLKNKNIAVFGAGGILGSTLVHSLLSANANVVALDLDLEKLLTTLEALSIDSVDQRLQLVKLDNTSEVDVRSFFIANSKLDGAVNCTYPRNKDYGKKLEDVSLESFNENLGLHLGSTFLLMREAVAHFKRSQKPFSFVNISSIYGVVGPNFDIYGGTSMTMPVEYAAIKSAIVHLNRYFVKYVADSDFRMNSVSPGGLADGQPEVFLEKYRAETFGKGMLAADDIVGSINFLLSDTSKYLNGQNLVVDDGFTL